MLPRVAADKLAEYCDVFCETGAFTSEESVCILGAAQQLGLKLRIHADQLSNNGCAQLAARLGAATADHLEHTAAEGIEALRSAAVQPVLLPGSVYALGSRRYPTAREMIDAGLALASRPWLPDRDAGRRAGHDLPPWLLGTGARERAQPDVSAVLLPRADLECPRRA